MRYFVKFLEILYFFLIDIINRQRILKNRAHVYIYISNNTKKTIASVV